MRQAFDIQMQLDYAVDNNLAREVEAFLKVDGSYERFEGIAVDGFEDALLFAVVFYQLRETYFLCKFVKVGAADYF